jgi:hypothetical protein
MPVRVNLLIAIMLAESVWICKWAAQLLAASWVRFCAQQDHVGGSRARNTLAEAL